MIYAILSRAVSLHQWIHLPVGLVVEVSGRLVVDSLFPFCKSLFGGVIGELALKSLFKQ